MILNLRISENENSSRIPVYTVSIIRINTKSKKLFSKFLVKAHQLAYQLFFLHRYRFLKQLYPFLF